MSQRAAGGLSSASADAPYERPAKASKVDSNPTKSHYSTATAHAVRDRPSSAQQSSSSRGHSKRFEKDKPRRNKLPVLNDPVHDEAHIKATYNQVPLKPEHEANPKSPLSNLCMRIWNKNPTYEIKQFVGPQGQLYRSTVVIDAAEPGEEPIVGTGDAPSTKQAEKLAALCALYQVAAKGLLDTARQGKAAQSQFSPTEVTLPDGSVVGFARARQFMDYYCRRFGFGQPEVDYQAQGNRGWEAVMTVGGRKIGLGSAQNKKAAMMACYVDVVQYLESCDPELWKKFVEDAKTGRDLGMAIPVLFEADQRVEDQINDLCSDIKKSNLYKNRPRLRSLMTGSDDPAAYEETAPQPKYVAPYRRKATAEFLENKSQELLERRRRYLENPAMETMRNTRAALPVYTKADELLEHIRASDVTICMAATGSGKTTQIPQLILDEWVDKGEGAKCNIFCTQPRRIAAISVAQRVAAERGETAGKGCIGYHVRFESAYPQEHGSVTFCTTGIFLKRMQSSLENTGRSNMDDVTHILVDEVHERDVDTDLLLTVLKRLLADRKARGIPIKVVLMSATIDPELFQEYFPDEQGRPASIINIPGRSFPVNKHFMDDFLPELASATTQSERWVFHEDSVQKYIAQELGPDLHRIPALSFIRPPARQGSSHDEDADIPHPLIALTISHVLRKTNDGHVLVFLPGWDDIVSVQKALLNPKGPLPLDFNNTSRFGIHCLHSTVPIAEQQLIFEPPPEGQRRIILATNIAETSVTIPNVVYVVDSAKVKEQRYDPERHISSLVSAWVGSSNLNQRAGRAGRHRSGEYYGILSRQRADHLQPHQTVEMKRVDLSNIVMHVKALNFPGMSVEEVLAATIEPPEPERVNAAMAALKMVGALDDKKNLTSLGRVLLQLPIDVQMGRLVLFGSFFRCLDQALTIAALLTSRDPFMSPMHLKEQAAARKNSFSPEEFRSDALAALRAYNKWWSMQSRGEYMAANRFCVDNFLSKPTLLMVAKLKSHILQSLYDVGVVEVSAGGISGGHRPSRKAELTVPDELNVNGESLPMLAALIAIALQPKFAIKTGDRAYRTAQDKGVFIHPSSVNNRKRDHDEQAKFEKQIIAYSEKRQNLSAGASAEHAQKLLVNTTRLDPLTYMLFGAHRVEVTRKGLDCDEWLPIIGDLNVLDDVERLKVMMESCMLRVFEGITKLRSKKRNTVEIRENESDDEDADGRNATLSSTEIKELDFLTQDIVAVLNNYSTYRVQTQSRHNSRPATPMDSPFWSAGMLPGPGSGARSGYSTPRYMSSVAFSSRPGTPSRFSRK